MENQELIKQVTEKAEKWLTPAYDAETQAEVKRMLENPDKTELIDSFYKDLVRSIDFEVGSDRDTALIGFVHQCPFQKVGIVKMIHNLECICIYEKSLYRLPFICFFLLFAMRQR